MSGTWDGCGGGQMRMRVCVVFCERERAENCGSESKWDQRYFILFLNRTATSGYVFLVRYAGAHRM